MTRDAYNVCAIDISTSKVKVLIGERASSENHEVSPLPRVLGVASAKQRPGAVSTPKKTTATKKEGPRGKIVNVTDVTKALEEALSSAVQQAGCEYLDEILVSVPSLGVESHSCVGEVSIPSKAQPVVDALDVSRAKERAKNNAHKEMAVSKYWLHEIQAKAIVDGSIARRPEGAQGKRLELEMQIITCPDTVIDTLEKCVQDALSNIGFKSSGDRIDFVLGSLAAAIAALDQVERKGSICFVDIGAWVTDVLVYLEGVVHVLPPFDFGGEDVNDAIRQGYLMHMGPSCPESLKIEHGSALEKCVDEKDRFLMPDNYGKKAAFKRHIFSVFIEESYQRLLCAIRERLKHAGLFDALKAQGAYIVFTGGGSQIPDLCQLSEETVGMKSRIGLRNTLEGLDNLEDAPQYAIAIGLLQPEINLLFEDEFRSKPFFNFNFKEGVRKIANAFWK